MVFLRYNMSVLAKYVIIRPIFIPQNEPDQELSECLMSFVMR